MSVEDVRQQKAMALLQYDELVKLNDRIVSAQNSLREALKVKQNLGLK